MAMALTRLSFSSSLTGGMDTVLNSPDTRGAPKPLDDDWREMLCSERWKCLYYLILFTCMTIAKDIKTFSTQRHPLLNI